jgi:AcrR family transcriptional regulator
MTSLRLERSAFVDKKSAKESTANDLRKGERTREEILDQALRTAARGGLGTLSIGNLAKEVNMSKSGLFVHFGSKENLEQAVVDRASDLFFNYVVLPTEESGLEGIEQLWTLCDLWLGLVEDRVFAGDYFFTGAFCQCARQDGSIPQRIAETVWRWHKALKRAVEKGQRHGEILDTIDSKRIALELNGLLLGAQWSHLMEGEDRTQARSAILAKLASIATDEIPASAFASLKDWRKYLESRRP